MIRRELLKLGSAAALLSAFPRSIHAQDRPSRPVRILVGFAAGGANDIVARLLAKSLTERIGQQVLVENKPGGGTNIATEAVIRSPPDGQTLLLVTAANAINASLYERLNFDFVRDIAPVSGVFRVPLVLVVNGSFPARTVAEFIAYGRSNPGKISYASGGTGTAAHLGGELFRTMSGVEMVHVPYRGSVGVLADLLGERLQAAFDPLPTSMAHIRSGRLRALAVTTATRSTALPDVPAIAEFLPGYEASAWAGIGAPTGTPQSVVRGLNEKINATLGEDELKTRLAELGASALPGSPEDFAMLIDSEARKWAGVVRSSGLTAR